MDSAIQNRKRALSLDHISKKPRITTTPSSTELGSPPGRTLNALCSICEAIFARIRSNNRVQWLEFHNTMGLVESAAHGCHLCTQLSEKCKGAKAGVNVESLKVETRYYLNLGVSLLLWRGDNVFADLDFRFERTLEIRDMEFPCTINTQSQSSWDQVLNWIARCSCCAACHTRAMIPPRDEWPERFIAVGNINNPIIRICNTSTIDCSGLVYMTLSHCWGNAEPTRLLLENQSRYREGIELANISKTFRDAVEVTRKLRVRYLWIDSLCIIQDSPKDWAIESTKMHQIYKNSHLNLAAAASPDANGGLFYTRSPLLIAPILVTIGKGENMEQAASTYFSEREHSTELVLFSRAWVFQEWLLAPRMLLFGKKELHWECNEFRGSETFPELETELENEGHQMEHMRKHWQEIPNRYESRRYWQEIHDKSYSCRLRVWSGVISEYSAMSLTMFSDKLIAVAGLASDLGRSWDNVSYLAGLWSYRLRQGLLWSSKNPGPKRQGVYTAPSWSWACVDGSIITSPSYEFSEGLVEVLETDIQLSMPLKPFGAVSNGYVKLRGPLIRAEITKNSKRRNWWIEFAKDSKEDTNDEFPRMKIEGEIRWDDELWNGTVVSAKVFLAPFQVFLPRGSSLGLEGLMLSPDSQQKGQFRRLGWFEVRDNWKKQKEFNANDLLKIVLPSDGNITSEERKVDEDGGDGDDDDDDDEDIVRPGRAHCVTALELQALFEEYERQVAQEQKTKGIIQQSNDRPAEDEHSLKDQRMKKRMRQSDDRLADDECSQESQVWNNDPYYNGPIRTTLFRRYKGLLDDMDYVQINSFLSLTLAFFELATENGALSKDLYEERHGDGYFTFRLV